MHKKTLILHLAIFFFSFPSGAQQLVLFSKAYENITYMKFIHRSDPSLVLRSAYGQPADSIDKWLGMASGIIITGGEDVHPSLYGKGDEIRKCESIDRYRDSLEVMLISHARENNIPLLGICRGEQILNVALGGSLYTDLPTDIGKKVRHRKIIGKPYHKVSIEESSLLFRITGVSSGTVNSFHHQGVDRPAESVAVAARSGDKLVEAIEYVHDGWTAIGVQWHPERLDFDNPLAGNIGTWFVSVLSKSK